MTHHLALLRNAYNTTFIAHSAWSLRSLHEFVSPLFHCLPKAVDHLGVGLSVGLTSRLLINITDPSKFSNLGSYLTYSTTFQAAPAYTGMDVTEFDCLD